MARRPLQEINAGSMADIAFLLLIFFLVTTTMSTNTGMQRRLPPMPEEQEDQEIEMKDRNVMVVLVNRDNHIAIKGRPILLKDVYNKTREFFENPNNDENLPEKEPREVKYFGQVYITRGVVSLQTDRNTNYKKYLQVQNELVRAVNDLRNELSLKKFGVLFDDLKDEDKQDAIGEIYPLNISEAEPRRMTTGGN